jgi:hypothetical protein
MAGAVNLLLVLSASASVCFAWPAADAGSAQTIVRTLAFVLCVALWPEIYRALPRGVSRDCVSRRLDGFRHRAKLAVGMRTNTHDRRLVSKDHRASRRAMNTRRPISAFRRGFAPPRNRKRQPSADAAQFVVHLVAREASKLFSVPSPGAAQLPELF